MPENLRIRDCVREENGALIFCEPGNLKRKLTSKFQIIDVFALKIASEYQHDETDKLILVSQPLIIEGKIWPLKEAIQLISNDQTPQKWVALEVNKYIWGDFFVRGGIQVCRECLIGKRISAIEATQITTKAIAKLLKKSIEEEDLLNENIANAESLDEGILDIFAQENLDQEVITCFEELYNRGDSEFKEDFAWHKKNGPAIRSIIQMAINVYETSSSKKYQQKDEELNCFSFIKFLFYETIRIWNQPSISRSFATWISVFISSIFFIIEVGFAKGILYALCVGAFVTYGLRLFGIFWTLFIFAPLYTLFTLFQRIKNSR